jgi:hypothetical protein
VIPLTLRWWAARAAFLLIVVGLFLLVVGILSHTGTLSLL